MSTAEKLQVQIEKLPESLQAEVLDFVEYLLTKTMRDNDDDWSSLSLATAMRGMEDEETSLYAISDLKTKF
jgi:hypothetical protein